ncbi:winged helix-turn-helix domain-containing protein [Actinoallomurus acanthiterrae]
MLRIHFTPDDLLETKVANSPDFMWEILLSAHLLRKRDGAVVFGGWKRRTRGRLPASAAMLMRLAPPWGYSADFLTPARETVATTDGFEAIMATPRSRLRRDLLLLDARRPLPQWGRPLADGEPTTLRRLDHAIRAYHDAAVAPYHRQIRAAFDADRMFRARALLDGGITGLLAGFCHAARWEPPVLSVSYPRDRDVHLNGRGLRLVPSFFCWRTPTALYDIGTDDPMTLVYPIAHDLAWTGGGPGREPQVSRDPLAALIGGSRAAVLAVIAEAGSTTTALAGRIGISAPAASRHVSALRDAGLVTSTRRGPYVLHTVTPLGTDLLAGGSTVLR